MRASLLAEAALVGLILAGLGERAAADPYVVVSSPPSPTVGYTMGGYEYNLGGGILVQELDGSGNFVSSSHGLPVVCESGCSGGTGGGGGTVTQGPQGTNTSPWFVSPGTSTFPVSGTVSVSGTTTVSLPGGAVVSGTVTAIPGAGTGTVVVGGASQPPLTGTSTFVLNSAPTVNQGVQGTNTSPWFVSPGTSTFPVSGTITAVPGAGTSTVLIATGTNTMGTVAVSGTVPVSGSFSSSISGWTPNGTFVTPLVSTNASSQIALPSGSVDVVTNVGTAVAFVNLGTSGSITATSSDTPVPIGGAIALTAGSFTNLAAITPSGTTTLNISGGGGLFTGLGGYSTSGGGGGGTVTQGPQGTNTSPWFVSPGTSTFPVSGTVAVSGTSTVVLNSAITVTANQGVQGTNTSPWFVSPGTSTFPVSGTVTNVPSGTQAVSGTVTAIPGAGTGTNVVTGTATITGTVSPLDAGTLFTGTATSAAVISTFPITSDLGYASVEWDISSLGSAGNIVSAQEEIGTTWYTIGTASAVGMYSARVMGTAFRLNETTYIGGTTTADALLRGAHSAVSVMQDPSNPWGPLTGTTTVAVGGTASITGSLTGTSTVAVANTPAVTISGTATTTEPNVNSNAGSVSTQVVGIQQIGAGTLGTGQVACGTTATVIVAARAARQLLYIENVGTGTVFIGGTAVTTAGGMLLPPIQGANMTIPTTTAVDCIATATDTISYMEVY